MNNINYSIIIPHKNIPQLLQRCLDSIPIRDDVQVIVVDDNSDTDKVNFDNFPKWKGKNYEFYLTKEGKGAGYARNIGLKHAKGKWLLFADADDYYNYCINSILDEYTNNEYDVVYFDSSSQDCFLYTNANRSTYTHQMIKLYEKDKEQGEFQLRYYLGVPWCKLIKHELIYSNNIRFDETPINNDTTFSYMIGIHAKTIDVDKRALYCITVRHSSTSYNLTDDKILASIDVFARKHKNLQEHGIDIFEGFIPYHMNKLLSQNRRDLYDKGIAILYKYGFDETLLKKETWQPPFFDEELNDSNSFAESYFGHEMIESYKVKGLKYKIILQFLYITNKLKTIC